MHTSRGREQQVHLSRGNNHYSGPNVPAIFGEQGVGVRSLGQWQKRRWQSSRYPTWLNDVLSLPAPICTWDIAVYLMCKLTLLENCFCPRSFLMFYAFPRSFLMFYALSRSSDGKANPWYMKRLQQQRDLWLSPGFTTKEICPYTGIYFF